MASRRIQIFQKRMGLVSLGKWNSNHFVYLCSLAKKFFLCHFHCNSSGDGYFHQPTRPRIIEFKIDNEGIYIGKDTAYKYDEIEWFAIRHRPESLNEIIIKKKTLVNPIVKIQADSKITSKARKILKEHLEEKEYESSLLDAILERFRF